MKLLEVKDLSIDFQMGGKRLPAVSGVSFDVEKGEVLALVGESGCGKSVTCLSLARLVPSPPAIYAGGSIRFFGEKGGLDVLGLPQKGLREFRRHCIAYIFQEPSVSLNPVFRIGDQIAESICLRGGATDVRAEVVSLLAQVGIPEPEQKISAYPHELSGGMQQRVMIAMALASNPGLLVADEPTTALDVTIQAQIIDLLRQIQKTCDMSIIMVTHNLGIVSDMAHRVIIMYAGHTVESASSDELLGNPAHPYTKALMAAVPRIGHEKEMLETIPGSVPAPSNYPAGCRFYGRCSLCEELDGRSRELCANTVPEWRQIKEGHWCRCHYSK